MSWFCSVVNSTCRKRNTYATFVMSWKEASLRLFEASLEATCFFVFFDEIKEARKSKK